jgi:uncharacterized protein YceH (UPF0502 family)
MLRGAQTPGELKQRSARLHDFADLAAIHSTLDRLIERGLVARQQRRPGQKEERYEQLLGAGEAEASPASVGAPAAGEPPSARATEPPAAAAQSLEPEGDRLARLEREVAELRSDLARLRESLGEG